LRVAKLYSFNDIRIEDIPVPEIGPDDALIKTRASGICSGDVMSWYIEKKAPLILGHEPAGEIVKVGDNVRSFKPGDRVFAHHHAPCLTCRYCRRGDYVQCETWKNTRIIPGGISEYILIPETNLKNDTLKLTENMSFEDGTLIEPTACVLKGLKRAGLRFENCFPKDTPHPNPLPQGEKGPLGSSSSPGESNRTGSSSARGENKSFGSSSSQGDRGPLDSFSLQEERGDNPTCPPLNLRGGKEGYPFIDGDPSHRIPSFDRNPFHFFPSLEGRGIGEGDVSFSDRTVLVIGLGVMGQLNILAARRFGAGRIIGADMVQYRLKKAREFGADDVIDVSKENLISSIRRLTDGDMADLIIVGPNSVEAMKEGISVAGAGGTVLLFTPAKPGEELLVDPNHLYFNDISIVTSYSCGPVETREALSLIEEGAVSAEKLVTHRFPVEKTAEAFKLTAEARESLKVVIMF
jgi:threonine dehydrogenase-like Zn-dependent dehydrogenase